MAMLFTRLRQTRCNIITVCLKTCVLLLLRYGETNRLGHDCHWKARLLLTGPKKRGACHQEGPHREAPASARRQRNQGQCRKSLPCGFCGKEQAIQDKWLVWIISAGSGAGYEQCPRTRHCPCVWYLVLGWLTQVERSPEGAWAGGKGSGLVYLHMKSGLEILLSLGIS